MSEQEPKIFDANLTDLKPTAKNPRQLSEKGYKQLKKKMDKYPKFITAREVVIDEDFNILGGHQRVKVAEKRGDKTIRVKQVFGWTQEEKDNFIISDNVSEGDWDEDILANEWDENDLSDWMGDELPNWEQVAQEIAEDEAPEVNGSEPADSVLGEVYQLGRHRLMCGDSTDAGSVAILMDGQKADMVFTDPPYGINMSRSLVSGKDNSILNDNLDEKEFCSLLDKAVVNMRDYSDGKCLFLWIGFRAYSKAETIVKKYYSIDNCIVWVKPSIGLGGKGYRFQHELCIFCGEIQNKSLSDVWEFDRDSQGLHPTMKPVQLVCKALKDCGGKTVLDLFGGSGSTLIACEQLGRKCFMMELDPKYCDVIRKRYWKFVNGSEEGWQDGTKAI